MSTLDDLITRAERALDDGDGDRALAITEEAVKLAPRDAHAGLLRVEALLAMERLDEAAHALDRLVHGHPQDLDVLLAAAEFASEFESEDHERMEDALDLLDRAQKLARKAGNREAEGRAEWVRGQVHGALAELAPAAAAYERARSILGDDHDLLVDLAVAWFEVLKVDGARRLLADAVKRRPDDARAHHFLGRVLERAGDVKEADRAYARATKLDPEGFPPPVTLPRARFEAIVERVLAAVPAPVKEALANVPVIVEDLPHADDLRDPPLSPMSLGMYKGHAVAGHGAVRDAMDLPSQVILYQKNLERSCADVEELEEEIETTVLHELGHAVGWDEDDLYDAGSTEAEKRDGPPVHEGRAGRGVDVADYVGGRMQMP